MEKVAGVGKSLEVGKRVERGLGVEARIGIRFRTPLGDRNLAQAPAPEDLRSVLQPEARPDRLEARQDMLLLKHLARGIIRIPLVSRMLPWVRIISVTDVTKKNKRRRIGS